MNKWTLLVGGIVLATAGCGGGGGGSDATAPTSSVSSNAYPNVAPTPGDSLTYNATLSSSNGTLSYVFTRYFDAVEADKSYSFFQTFSVTDAARVHSHLNPSGAEIRAQLDDTSASFPTCTNSTAVGPTSPYSVGQQWSDSWTRTCVMTNGSAGPTYQESGQGSYTGVENIQTTAGSFRALKFVSTNTSQRSDLANAPVTTTQSTCWSDVVTGRSVKCQSTISTAATATTPASTRTGTMELSSFIIAGLAGSSASVARFAGSWTGSFNGPDHGTCSNIAIAIDGTLNGTCTGVETGDFSIAGAVDGQGNVSFARATSLPGDLNGLFSGRLTSPVAGNGGWSGTMGSGGTWTMSHR